MSIADNARRYTLTSDAVNEAIGRELIDRNYRRRDRKEDLRYAGELYDMMNAHNKEITKIGGPVDWQRIQTNRSAVNSGITGVFDNLISERKRLDENRTWLDHQRDSQQRMTNLMADRVARQIEQSGVPFKTASLYDSNYKASEDYVMAAEAQYQKDKDYEKFERAIGLR
tara:strand:- start:4637 stop:5146 length:510 start_codon:yes stop_codon:yes gene_type:complete